MYFIFESKEDIVTENLAPVFLGEWGTCYTDQSCVSSQSAWMECLTSFIKDNDLDWFYWYVCEERGEKRG